MNKDGTHKRATQQELLDRMNRERKTREKVAKGMAAYATIHHLYTLGKTLSSYNTSTEAGRAYYERQARARGATNITWLD